MTDWSENIFKDFVKSALRSSAEVKKAMEKETMHSIIAAASMIAGCLKKPGRKIIFCGNGGSAADSQHLAAEFVVRLSASRERRALPGLALTTDTSTLTAAANDYGYDGIFARQVEALGNEGDVLVCISTSGNSLNVVKAAEAARPRGVKLIGFLGREPGLLGPLMDISVNIPSDVCNRVQEGHITAGHIIVELVENILFDGKQD